MPVRQIPLVNGHYYHIYNRGVARAPVFHAKYDYRYMVESLAYYRFSDVPVRQSTFIHLPEEEKHRITGELARGKRLVQVAAYVLMPNHFHLLLQQVSERGIIRYMARAMNSYVRYFNTKRKRVGPLFQGVYKAVYVESNEQLLHLTRYIHLNPFVSGVVAKDDLFSYPWSSLPAYVGNVKSFVENTIIVDQFSSQQKYTEFVLDQADYAGKLEEIKHIALDFDSSFPKV